MSTNRADPARLAPGFRRKECSTWCYAIVAEEPRLDTPIVLDGDVLTVDQVGETIIVGGNFTQVQTERDGEVVDQVGLFAYDALTGEFNENFRPILTNSGNNPIEVRDIEPAPDGRSAYIGGNFRQIDDGAALSRDRVAKIDVVTGQVDETFALASFGSQRSTLAYSDGWLYVGGSIESVRDLATGVDHQIRGLARIDADTGAFDTSFRYETRVDIGHVAEATGIRTVGVSHVDVTPDGTRLVVGHRGAEFFDVTPFRSSITLTSAMAEVYRFRISKSVQTVRISPSSPREPTTASNAPRSRASRSLASQLAQPGCRVVSTLSSRSLLVTMQFTSAAIIALWFTQMLQVPSPATTLRTANRPNSARSTSQTRT